MGGLLIGVLVATAAWLAAGALQQGAQRDGAYHGVLTIEGFCRYDGRHNVSDCTGTFRSDDGTVEVHDVAFDIPGRKDWLPPAEPIPARLAGPSDRSAVTDKDASTDSAVRGVLSTALVVWALGQSVWWIRHRRRTRHHEKRDPARSNGAGD